MHRTFNDEISENVTCLKSVMNRTKIVIKHPLFYDENGERHSIFIIEGNICCSVGRTEGDNVVEEALFRPDVDVGARGGTKMASLLVNPRWVDAHLLLSVPF